VKRNVTVLVKTDKPFVEEAVATFKDVEDADFERLKELLRRVRID